MSFLEFWTTGSLDPNVAHLKLSSMVKTNLIVKAIDAFLYNKNSFERGTYFP